MSRAQLLFRPRNLGPRDVEFKAEIDGTAQKYVEMLPKGWSQDKICDVLVVLHGHGSDRWQYIRAERGECKAARDFAAKPGLILISPDYRPTTSWMGPKAESDVVQLIGDIRKKYSVDRVYLAGGSMGGTSALIFAALHPGLIAGVCSQNGSRTASRPFQCPGRSTSSFSPDKSAHPQN